MFFGGISYNLKTPLIFVDGNINVHVYVDDCIDGSELIPDMNRVYGPWQWSLLQYGAKCHTTFSTLDYLNDYCNVFPNCPPNSPDLNPIENLWSIIKGRVEDVQPQSIDDLIDLTFQTWDSISMNEIHNLIYSVPNRLQVCIRNNGMQTGY